MNMFILFGMLAMTYAMVVSKRMRALITCLRLQSLFLFLETCILAFREKSVELCVVATLLFVLKVAAIPHFLLRIMKRTGTNENLGLFVNAQMSLVFALALTYIAYLFSRTIYPAWNTASGLMLTVSFSITLIGMFIMIVRMRAIAQIIGLIVMENGLFLLAASISGGMPFFVEIAIFFDVFISVLILGVFVYRINKLFTHIDTSKLADLKG